MLLQVVYVVQCLEGAPFVKNQESHAFAIKQYTYNFNDKNTSDNIYRYKIHIYI